MLDIVTADGFVTANVAYELTTALKERIQFECRYSAQELYARLENSCALSRNICVFKEHHYASVASIVLTQYTMSTMLYIVTADGVVTANVAYELRTALKERLQFVCRDILHRNCMRDLRTALHSRATFVSFWYLLRNRHL
jgi:hypothetical protein